MGPSCELTYSTWLVNRSLPVSTRAWTRGTSRSRPGTPIRGPRCGRARKNLDRHPNYILAAYMASGT